MDIVDKFVDKELDKFNKLLGLGKVDYKNVRLEFHRSLVGLSFEELVIKLKVSAQNCDEKRLVRYIIAEQYYIADQFMLSDHPCKAYKIHDILKRIVEIEHHNRKIDEWNHPLSYLRIEIEKLVKLYQDQQNQELLIEYKDFDIEALDNTEKHLKLLQEHGYIKIVFENKLGMVVKLYKK